MELGSVRLLKGHPPLMQPNRLEMLDKPVNPTLEQPYLVKVTHEAVDCRFHRSIGIAGLVCE